MHAPLLAVLVAIAAMTLPGCTTGASTAPAQATAPIGVPIPMTPGQRIVLPDGATLRYLEVAADSRCPPGVQCIRAGDADVVFEFTAARQGPPSRITVNTDPPATAGTGQWRLRVLALAVGESPLVTVQIDPASP